MATTKPIIIEAQTRQSFGKGPAHRLRKAGKIPGNIIGQGKAHAIELDPKLLSKAYKAEGRVFQLKLDGQDPKQVTIKEIQIDPVKRQALHVDLMYV